MTYPPTWKWLKHGKVLAGTYMGAFPGVGPKGRSILYAIKDKAGKTWTIWGVAEIKQALQLRHPGKKVRFEYLGMRKSKKGFLTMHFKINIGRGDKDADPTNVRGPLKKRVNLAARHNSTRQSLSRPIMTGGRGRDHASAAKIIKDISIPQPVVQLASVTLPPPLPPSDYKSDHPFLTDWARRIKKL